MATLNELKYSELFDATGATTPVTLNELEIIWLASKGYTTGTLQERYHQWFDAEGIAEGTYNERFCAYLIGLGYTGTFNEMLYQWYTEGLSNIVFRALADVAGSFVNDVITGVGVLTEANTSTRYYADDSSVWQSFGSGVQGKTYANGQWWLVGQKACTNQLIWSSDLTNWTPTGAVVTYDQVGITGAANSASLVDLDVDSSSTRITPITGGTSTQPVVVRLWLKRVAQTGNLTVLNDVAAGVGQWTVDTSLISDTDYEVVTEEHAAVTVVTPFIVSPAGTAAVALRKATAVSTLRFVVGQAEMHENTTIAAVRKSSPLFTAGSTTTINASDLSFDIGNHAQDQGLYYCEFLPMVDKAAIPNFDLGLATTTHVEYGQMYASALNVSKTYDGTNTSTSTPAIPWVADTVYQVATGYDSVESKMWAQMDASRSADGTYDGAYDLSLGKMATLGGADATVMVRDIRRYDSNLVDGKALADELIS